MIVHMMSTCYCDILYYVAKMGIGTLVHDDVAICLDPARYTFTNILPSLICHLEMQVAGRKVRIVEYSSDTCS